MAKQEATPSVEFPPFKGLATNRNDDPTFFVSQDNLQCLQPGMLRVRKGLRPVTFSNAQAATSNNVIAMYRFQGALVDSVLYEDASGALRIGKSPS